MLESPVKCGKLGSSAFGGPVIVIVVPTFYTHMKKVCTLLDLVILI